MLVLRSAPVSGEAQASGPVLSIPRDTPNRLVTERLLRAGFPRSDARPSRARGFRRLRCAEDHRDSVLFRELHSATVIENGERWRIGRAHKRTRRVNGFELVQRFYALNV